MKKKTSGGLRLRRVVLYVDSIRIMYDCLRGSDSKQESSGTVKIGSSFNV